MTIKDFILKSIPIVQRFGVSAIACIHVLYDSLNIYNCFSINFDYVQIDFFGYILGDIIFTILTGFALLTLIQKWRSKEFRTTLIFFIGLLVIKFIPISIGILWFVIGVSVSIYYLTIILLLTINERKLIEEKMTNKNDVA